MTIHREGYLIIGITAILLIGINLLALQLPVWLETLIALLSAGFFLLVLQFFRHPRRPLPAADNRLVYAPADGKIVVIEEAYEPEYFQDKRLQISIFMSPLNVHVNRNPVSGVVKYKQHHPGKYLVAWHPKSSTENERTTVVLHNGSTDILLRQIAGAVARRIRNYLQPGQPVVQGTEMGFIKFGSRVDVFLPLNAEVQVRIGQAVKGNEDVLAKLLG
ncbi:MAG TPA: phosphatidylserine decarboxylase family protein [Saprospiraceae bacterium]|mgnify:FL=1|nr:phosphatidylserine decarboxylase family protein [Saprospiraceae bacterium]HMP22712.1 phosphatidylserine decarboxylase family protein [Saprospiraceae bacterium]